MACKQHLDSRYVLLSPPSNEPLGYQVHFTFGAGGNSQNLHRIQIL